MYMFGLTSGDNLVKSYDSIVSRSHPTFNNLKIKLLYNMMITLKLIRDL